MSPAPRAVPLLLVVLAGLAGLLAWEGTALLPGPDVPVPTRTGTVLPGPGGSAPVADDAALASTMLARPLFSPTRRPAAGPGAVVAGLPRLTGVVVSDAGRLAMFAGEGGARGAVLAEGGTVGQFTVRGIAPGEVTLDGPGGLHSLRPGPGGTRVAAPPSPAPTSARTAAQIMRDGLPPAPATPGLTMVPGAPPSPPPAAAERAAALQQLLSAPLGGAGAGGVGVPGLPATIPPLSKSTAQPDPRP